MPEERRAYERISASLPINYETLDTADKKYGTTLSRDISQGGIKILFDRFYALKTKFLLKVELENNHKIFEGIAESVWSVDDTRSNRYYNGLRFIDITKENQDILKQYINIQTILV